MKNISRVLILTVLIFSSSLIHGQSIEITGGGGLTGYLIPTINYVSSTMQITVDGRTRTYRHDSINLYFGLALSVPVSVVYYLKNNVGLGGCFELGYSFQGGPHVYYSNPDPRYVPTSYWHFFHAFVGTFNFVVKSPPVKSFRFMAEFGLIIRPGIDFTYQSWNNIVWDRGYRFLFYAGPNIFLGFHKTIRQNLIITPGLRISAEFSGFQASWPGHYQRDSHVLANFGLEFRIAYRKVIGLGSNKSNNNQPAKDPDGNNNSNQQPKKKRKL